MNDVPDPAGYTVEHLVRISGPGLDLMLPRERAKSLQRSLNDAFSGEMVPIPIGLGPCDLDRVRPFSGPPLPVAVFRVPELRPTVADPFPEPGPTLQDDIENMSSKQSRVAESITTAGYWDCECEFDYIHPKTALKCDVCGTSCYDQPDSRVSEVAEWLRDKPYSRASANHIVDANKMVDDADEQEAEPPAEPEPTKGKRGGGRTGETDEQKALRLWHMYSGRLPDARPNAIVAKVSGHIPHLSTPQVRELIRSLGIKVPDPMTRAEVVEQAKRVRLERLKAEADAVRDLNGTPSPASVASPTTDIELLAVPTPFLADVPEVSIQLIHVLARSGRRRFPGDSREIAERISDLGPGHKLWFALQAGTLSAWETTHRAWLDAYSELPPFKQRDIDSKLHAEWKVAA